MNGWDVECKKVEQPGGGLNAEAAYQQHRTPQKPCSESKGKNVKM